jgi:hypothetical protein
MHIVDTKESFSLLMLPLKRQEREKMEKDLLLSPRKLVILLESVEMLRLKFQGF